MKKIIITGASRGIGLFLANRLQDDGFQVVGIARNFSSNTNFENLICDVGNFSEVVSAFSNFKKDKAIYGLINCAGVLHTKPVISLTENEINETINTNFLGSIYCCKNIIRPLLAHRSGRIINFSSIAATCAFRGDSIYSASKAAIEVFTKSFAKELSDKAITVNCISPGVIKTDMTKTLTDEQFKNLISQQIIRNSASFEDIYNSVNFLLSSQSNMITGESFHIGGV
jgi:3-oxoacyl-[acyl-carrier protein] reductase